MEISKAATLMDEWNGSEIESVVRLAAFDAVKGNGTLGQENSVLKVKEGSQINCNDKQLTGDILIEKIQQKLKQKLT